jgi:hypothetical protein
LISLFATKERKHILPFVAFYNCHFRALLFEYFSVCVVGTCQTCYWSYCLSLITVLQLSVLLQTLSIQPHQIIQRDISIKTSSLGNGGESEKVLLTFSVPNDLPNNLLKYCTWTLNHPAFQINLGYYRCVFFI